MTAPITLQDEQQDIPEGALSTKLILIAMPKCGLHALVSAVRPVAAVWIDAVWIGSFDGYGWKTSYVDNHLEQSIEKIQKQPEGTFMRGHLAPHPDIVQEMYDQGSTPLFIYRNLRDVAVSSTYHIRTAGDEDGDGILHFNPQPFKDMDFEDALAEVIRGGHGMDSLVSRWHSFKGWMDIPWILKVKYEYLVEDFYSTAMLMFRYIAGRAALSKYGDDIKLVLNRDQADEVVSGMRHAFGQKSESPTFRRGKPGGWRDDWNDRAEKAFRDTGAMEANWELGYE